MKDHYLCTSKSNLNKIFNCYLLKTNKNLKELENLLHIKMGSGSKHCKIWVLTKVLVPVPDSQIHIKFDISKCKMLVNYYLY